MNQITDTMEMVSHLSHPAFCVRDGMIVQRPQGLFGLETFNGGTPAFRNDLARLFADHYGLAQTSGSDIHNMNRLAKGGIRTEHRIRTPEDLIHVLRSGEYTLIKPEE